MTTINEILRTFGPEYLERYGQDMPNLHRKVIYAIIDCSTEACGVALYECEKCGQLHRVYRSCGNRHCPTCQYHKSRQWLEKQLKHQLPGHHFLLTFTVPETLRRFIRKNQRIAYSALFKTSSEAMKKLALDQHYIGGDLPGFFGILHTWGRTLEYHPHIHYIVPGGALSSTDGLWHPSRFDFYLPVKALSQIFKAKFRDEMKQAGLFDQIPPEVWQIDWNVNSQAVVSSEASLKYLAPYVFKVAISNSRILKVQDRTVFIHYRKPHCHRLRTIALEVMEFIRRFLQHVLPTGFMKVRYYGFMNPNCAVSLDHIRTLIELAYGFNVTLPNTDLEPWQPITCPTCGGPLKLRSFLLPSKALVWPG
ncbi:MAG: transposase [Deltaproteobacteria bacterium]|nr:transposase [Deltaproteobacteria bacterium]